MADNHYGGIPQRLLQACLLFLLCAIVLAVTVSVIRDVWPWLVGIAAVVGAGIAGWAAWSRYQGRW
ncbi:hypothetical protein D1871_23005 [Nakamurella silvestris]|nr:hypothetical protein D1871_23005 [Nakamurella silvestris]